MKIRWIEAGVVLAVHDVQIAEHGGVAGIRDFGLLESALARPKNRFGYTNADLFDLAASYGFGIARNHPFIDGNKRTAYVVTRLFLRLNGLDLTAPPAERVLIFERVGHGSVSEKDLGAWFRANGP